MEEVKEINKQVEAVKIECTHSHTQNLRSPQNKKQRSRQSRRRKRRKKKKKQKQRSKKKREEKIKIRQDPSSSAKSISESQTLQSAGRYLIYNTASRIRKSLLRKDISMRRSERNCFWTSEVCPSLADDWQSYYNGKP